MQRADFIKNTPSEPHLAWRGQHIWNNPYNRFQSVCLLEIYIYKRRRVAIATEIKENTGPSITNSAEFLWKSLENFNGAGFDYAFETYDGEKFDRVEVIDNKATWHHVGSLKEVWESLR
jgi:mannose-1-phosphate guanylyltransferase